MVLLLVAAVVAFGYKPDEFHFNGDEMRHAVTGIFFRDAIVDHPTAHARQYAFEYYAKYPALGIPQWPPFFYLVEGIFFLAFGISVLSARLAILLFSLLAAYFWFRIAERQGSLHRAILSTLIFPLVPWILLYERSIMLEIPLLGLSLATIYFWLRFLETESRFHLFLVGALSAMAFLTSQKAMFLPVLIIAHFVMERRFRLLLRWDIWVAAIVSAGIVTPWYLYTFKTLSLSYERVTGEGAPQYLAWGSTLTWYFERLPWQTGAVISFLALAGLGWTILRAPRQYRFLILWVLSCYVLFTYVREKDTRHTMIWIPPLVYFALLAIEQLCANRKWAYIPSLGLTVWMLVGAVQFDRPRLVGIEDVAKFVLSQPESDVIYYQGRLNGNFIFWVRKNDPEKRRLVAREKQIVTTNIVPSYGRREVLRSQDEIIDFFRTWGIRYAVIENRDWVDELAPMRKLLNSPAFELVRIFPITANIPTATEGPIRLDLDRKVYVYRFTGELHRTSGPTSIPMLTIKSDIPVDLNRLAGRPWPN